MERFDTLKHDLLRANVGDEAFMYYDLSPCNAGGDIGYRDALEPKICVENGQSGLPYSTHCRFSLIGGILFDTNFYGYALKWS